MNQLVLNYFTTIYLAVNKFSNYKNKERATKDIIISQIASTLFALIFPTVLYFLKKSQITFSNKVIPIIVILIIFLVLVVYPIIKYINNYFSEIDIHTIVNNKNQNNIKSFLVSLVIIFHPLLSIILLIMLSKIIWGL